MLGLQYQVKENVGIGLIAGNKYYFTSIPILTEKQRPSIMSIGLSVRMSVGDSVNIISYLRITTNHL